MTLKNIIVLLFLVFASFAKAQTDLNYIDKAVNFGFAHSNSRKIDVIIIHSTFNNSGGEFYDIDLIIKQFARYKVSAHYVLGRDGSVFQLVDEQNVAYHAGKSKLPDARTAVNSCSIGIEIMTSFDEAPTDLQIEALLKLVDDIKSRHPIKYVLRHSDIAPGRKTDPWNMDWESFNQQLSTMILQ
jgi:N-acetyl-anhydromuramyl-L-alanine amidase AmpD